jgi:hypothetical protein
VEVNKAKEKAKKQASRNFNDNSKHDYYGFSNQDDESHYTPSKIIKNNEKSIFKDVKMTPVGVGMGDSKFDKVNISEYRKDKNEINLTISNDDSESENGEVDLDIDFKANKGEVLKIDDSDTQKENIECNRVQNKGIQKLEKGVLVSKNDRKPFPNLPKKHEIEQPNIISSKIFKDNAQNKKNEMKYQIVTKAVAELIGDLKSYKTELSIKEGKWD